MSSEAKIQKEQFATILMELTMQYANITDAHTFLLIETESTRRYAGKPHLKELYKRGELKPCGRDSEITIDPSLSQMVEVSHDDEEEESKPSDTLPRRHIGELPSERKERQRSTMKAYKKFVSLTPNADQSFATYLMEALMKFANMTDASIFFLVETRFQRRFTGREHLCEQYLEGTLRPTGDDVEIELNPEVKVVTERRLAKPKNDESEEKSRRSSVEGGGEAEEEEENGSEVKTEDDVDSERQRNESEASMDSSEQPAKRKHVGLLPSERKEQKRKKIEDEINARLAVVDDPERKHKGELPSQRKERIRRERERENKEVKSGPGFIFGPSSFPSSYADGVSDGYNDGNYGWGQAATGFGSYDGGYGLSGQNYSTTQYPSAGQSSNKSSYGNWKSGGTMYGGQSNNGTKSGKSNYGW